MKKIITIATGSALALSGMMPMLAFAQDSGMPQNADEVGTTPPSTSDGRLKNIQMLTNIYGEVKNSTDAPSPELQRAREEERRANATRLASTTSHPQRVDAEAHVMVANKMIDNRLELLKKLADRIAEAKYLTADQKSVIILSLTGTTNNLLEIKSGISSTTGKEELKADEKEVRTANRVYALVHPQTAIQAASDRILTIVTQMETLSTKLSARIAEMKAAGKDTTKEDAAYADFTLQVGAAKVAAHAALDGVVSLKADNGDDAVAASNKAALKAARASLEVAQKALKAARKDISVIFERTKGHDEERKTATTTVEVKAGAAVSN